MARGRKPEPLARLKLRGSTRVSALERRGTPQPPASMPPAPAWLSKDAQDLYIELGSLAHGLGVMAKPHAVALALAAEAMADYVKLRDEAEKVEAVVTGERGAPYQHPIIGMRNAAWKRVLVALREFGLTPTAARSVTTAADPEASSPGSRQYPLGPRLS